MTCDITDWQVTNPSSAPNSGWYYRSQNPYNSDNNPYCGGQQSIYADGCYLNSPNELSLNTMQLHTQAVWRSPDVLTDWITVNTATKHHAVDLYCEEDVLFACQYKAIRALPSRLTQNSRSTWQRSCRSPFLL